MPHGRLPLSQGDCRQRQRAHQCHEANQAHSGKQACQPGLSTGREQGWQGQHQRPRQGGYGAGLGPQARVWGGQTPQRSAGSLGAGHSAHQARKPAGTSPATRGSDGPNLCSRSPGVSASLARLGVEGQQVHIRSAVTSPAAESEQATSMALLLPRGPSLVWTAAWMSLPCTLG